MRACASKQVAKEVSKQAGNTLTIQYVSECVHECMHGCVHEADRLFFDAVIVRLLKTQQNPTRSQVSAKETKQQGGQTLFACAAPGKRAVLTQGPGVSLRKVISSRSIKLGVGQTCGMFVAPTVSQCAEEETLCY